MIRRTLLTAAVLALLAPSAVRAQDAEPAADDNTVFRAIEAEMTRAKALKMKDLDTPYYLEAFVTDDESFNVSASFGALTGAGGGKSSSVSTGVRVGSMDLDNTNYSSFGFFGFGGGATPSEPDFDALRQALWLDFDREYKSAAQTIAKKRAYLAANTVKERLPDFTKAETTDLFLPREKLDVDKKELTELIKRVSGVFREYPFVYRCSVSLSASVAHQYFVSTDPAKHLFPFPHCSINISASTQADDGMSLSSNWKRMSRGVGDLPSEPELMEAAHAVAKRLGELKNAPTAGDYWGPVLFTGEAAAEFFIKTVGDPLSHVRQDLGSSSGGRLVDRMGRRIASKFITVRDDPTQTEWNGKPLLGHFPVDDDGVKPQPITLIDKGFLRTYYMSRVPTKHVKETNGHSRAGEGSMGNLFVDAAETVSREELEKRLLELAKDEDLEFGLIVEQMGGSSGGFSFFGGSSQGVRLPRPYAVYRLYQDGRRQMVRGSAFLPASYRVLRDIVAAGDDPVLVNTRQFSQLVSVVAPSILVAELELKRPREEFSKPPYSGRPELSK